jgi:hypothetical protein
MPTDIDIIYYMISTLAMKKISLNFSGGDFKKAALNFNKA